MRECIDAKMDAAARAAVVVCVAIHLAIPQATAADAARDDAKGLKLLRAGALYPKWSHARNRIVFNELVEGEAFTDKVPGTYEILTMTPEGADVQCLTKNAPPELRKHHKSQPFWHPSGDYIIFTAQNEHTKPTQFNLDSFPGIGHNHDVWIMTSDGKKYWQITHYPDNWGAIRPSFSHDGKTVYWNEEYSMEAYPGEGSKWNKDKNRKGEEWGLWRIEMGSVAFQAGAPVVTNLHAVNINELHPGFRLIEGSGLTPDDEHLIWEAANINETEGKMWWGDVYVSDLEGGTLKRITRTAPLRQGNENMEYSPDGKRIAWSHHDDEEPGRKVEIYLMNADGSNPTRLTYFNQLGHAHRKAYQSTGFTNACGELDWAPDGKSVIFGMSNGGSLKWPYVKPNLYVLTLGEQNR